VIVLLVVVGLGGMHTCTIISFNRFSMEALNHNSYNSNAFSDNQMATLKHCILPLIRATVRLERLSLESKSVFCITVTYAITIVHFIL